MAQSREGALVWVTVLVMAAPLWAAEEATNNPMLADRAAWREAMKTIRRTTPGLNRQALTDFLGLLDTFNFWFNIVTP